MHTAPLALKRPRERATAWLATTVTAGVLTAFVALAADTLRRTGWRHVDALDHATAALVLQTCAGALSGLAFGALTALETVITRGVARRAAGAARAAGPAFYGLVAMTAVWSTAFWAFTGHGVQGTKTAAVGPYVLIGIAGASAVAAAVLARWGLAQAAERRLARAGVAGLTFAVAAVGAMWVDLTWFVALYSRLHTALEVVSAIAWLCAFLIALRASAARRGRAAPRAVGAVAALAAAWLVVLVVSSGVREQAAAQLKHVWRSPAYVDRTLARLQVAEAFLRDPGAWRGITASRLARVQEAFDISTIALAPKWNEPLAEPKAFRERIDALRRPRRDFGVVVFYIDTLRHDAAADPAVMPNLVALAKESLEFRNAYATASDTLRSLPGIVNGSYTLAPHKNGLLQVAEREGMPSCLFIARSASRFLKKLLPSFELDEKVVIGDYSEYDDKVWGYGGDRSTAEPIVDRALQWLSDHRDERYFAWLFHYDVHNWRELERDYVYGTAKRLGVPDEAPLNWRYRVAARGVDEQLGRFLRGLDRLGLAEKTIVVVVSDHGEALGQHGFWVHSVVLWESLVHVPLVVRVPGLRSSVIDDTVSLVDIAPTITRYVSPASDMTGYQGEDLVGYLAVDRPPRRLPVLMASTSKHTLVRAGMVDRPYKLVLQLESAVAELHDLRIDDADDVDVSAKRRAELGRMMSELVRSPVFPRDPDATDRRR